MPYLGFFRSHIGAMASILALTATASILALTATASPLQTLAEAIGPVSAEVDHASAPWRQLERGISLAYAIGEVRTPTRRRLVTLSSERSEPSERSEDTLADTIFEIDAASRAGGARAPAHRRQQQRAPAQQPQQQQPEDALGETLSSERTDDSLTNAIDSAPAARQLTEHKEAPPRAPARPPQQQQQRGYRTPPASQVMRYMGASAIQHARGAALPYSMFGPILPSLEREGAMVPGWLAQRIGGVHAPARAPAPAPRRSDAEVAAMLEGVGAVEAGLGAFA